MIHEVLKQAVDFKGSFINGKWQKHPEPIGKTAVKSPANVAQKLPDISFHYDHVELSAEAGKKARARGSADPSRPCFYFTSCSQRI
jgi:hypothetical protein